MLRTRMARLIGQIVLCLGLCFTTMAASATGTYTLPQFVFGGGWYTAIYFTNMTGGEVSFPVYFYSDSGAALTVPSLGASSTTVTIASYGTAVIEAPNTGSLQQGFATFTLPTGVGGYGVFRAAGSSGAQEAVVPFASSSGTTATLIFDENGLSTGVAIANPGTSQTTITATARDLTGSSIGSSTITLPALNHTAAVLSAFSGLGGVSGQRGTVQFTASTGTLAVLGLRFNGSAFTSIPQTTPAAATLTSTAVFKTGQYKSPSNIWSGKGLIDIAGPGISSDGSQLYTLSVADKGDSYTYPRSATWYVGPAANSPWASRLTKTGITSTAWSYGVGNGPNGSYWGSNALLGFSQIGDTITIACFTKNGTDQATPVDQITYTLTSAAAENTTSTTALKAGTYHSPSTIWQGNGLITLAGPGGSGSGITQWSIAAAAGGDSYTYPSVATIYVGSIADHPWSTRIKSAGINSTALSYGVGNGPNGSYWGNNALMGFSQVGNTLTIFCFTSNSKDYATPVDQITYTLQ